MGIKLSLNYVRLDCVVDTKNKIFPHGAQRNGVIQIFKYSHPDVISWHALPGLHTAGAYLP